MKCSEKQGIPLFALLFPCDRQHTIICYCSVQHFGMYNTGCTAELLKVFLRALYS